MEGYGQAVAALTDAVMALYGEPEPHGPDLVSDIATKLHTLADKRRSDAYRARDAAHAPGTIVVRGREVMVLNFAGQWLAPGVAVPMPSGPDQSWDVLREGYGGETA